MKNSLCKLLKSVLIEDDLGNQIEQHTEREVFCEEFSVGSSEFFSAGVQGFKSELGLKVDVMEYDREEKVVYNNEQYRIYRTFKKGRDVELYLTGEM